MPRVLQEGTDGEREWLLTAALPGVNATDGALTADPPRLVPLLAQGLRRFHALEVEGCPFDGRLETTLATVRHRLAAGLERKTIPCAPSTGSPAPAPASTSSSAAARRSVTWWSATATTASPTS